MFLRLSRAISISLEIYSMQASAPLWSVCARLWKMRFQPLVVEHWAKAEFPHEVVPKIGQLGIGGVSYQGFGCAGGTDLLSGVITMTIARSDPSIGTFYAVQSGLAMGSIYLCGSDEQKNRWLPAMAKFQKIGSFGLTEPDVGSATSRGMQTTCRREGDNWIINGQKKWIGNATFSDNNVIWARDEATRDVKGFLVEKSNPGFKAEKIQRKISLADRPKCPHYAN